MYQVSIDGGRVYLDGRLANLVLSALEHFKECDAAFKYQGDDYNIERAMDKLKRKYDDMNKEHKDVDFSSGWGELK